MGPLPYPPSSATSCVVQTTACMRYRADAQRPHGTSLRSSAPHRHPLHPFQPRTGSPRLPGRPPGAQAGIKTQSPQALSTPALETSVNLKPKPRPHRRIDAVPDRRSHLGGGVQIHDVAPVHQSSVPRADLGHAGAPAALAAVGLLQVRAFALIPSRGPAWGPALRIPGAGAGDAGQGTASPELPLIRPACGRWRRSPRGGCGSRRPRAVLPFSCVSRLVR